MRNFPLVGNASVKKAVDSIISSDRIPHAILIEGDDGLGKHTLAAYLAKSAVCDRERPFCDECKNCHLADILSHPDISFLSPEEGKKNISVAQIRTLRADAFVKAHSARNRVFIIEKADFMNEQSQNALLKVLEEPPKGVIFILLASSRTKLLDTIISRCSVLSLFCAQTETAVPIVCEKTGVDTAKAEEALKSVGNNIGRAIEKLSQKQDDRVALAAKEFIKLLFSGGEYELLMLLMPFEKDRVGTDEFFEKLKIEICKELKSGYKSVNRSRVLTRLYGDIDSYERLLKTNVNLPLLFSAVVSKCKSYLRGEI